jgi:fatty acid desaturase
MSTAAAALRARSDAPAGEPAVQDGVPKPKFYVHAARELRRELSEELDTDALRRLHQKRAWRHVVVVGRLLGLQALASWAILSGRFPGYIEALAIVWSGFTAFNFTVLLHDALHGCVFARRRPRADRWLQLAYAMPSGISATQFRRWHLDHHDELGDSESDPKRHHLSPKRNARWFKLLYATPALFPIYFRAAARETATYPSAVRRLIKRERLTTIGLHLVTAAALSAWVGPWMMAKLYLIPYLFVFPVAFTLNRLGQHYAVDPSDIRKWTTRMKRNLFWDFVYLNSTYHLEHHYFPSVPLYNLRRLNALLTPYLDRIEHRPVGYGELIWGWIVDNQKPHTRWTRQSSATAPVARR